MALTAAAYVKLALTRWPGSGAGDTGYASLLRGRRTPGVNSSPPRGTLHGVPAEGQAWRGPVSGRPAPTPPPLARMLGLVHPLP